MKLEGKTALVTGAGRGIGRGIALELAKEGADVVVHYRSSERQAIETAETIRSSGGKALLHRADLSDVKQIGDMMVAIREQWGGIDILVNNSAVDPTYDFFEVTEERWDEVLDTNLKGGFFCAQACARDMVKKGAGKIIFISSVHANTTMPKYSAYAASKGGINAMTRQLALDLAQYNIQVNAIAPGATDVEKFHGKPGHDPAAIGEQIPLGRIGYPEDVAKVVAFFASSDSNFVTGQVLTVDGGSSTRFFLRT
ncbi:SDR family NAD(P)-dependent oxidoreductase [Cohnella hashimotonis]|uniref:3-oxoacyl-ACP reductase family protein n=1 Tax=Cohnella hashimotonis TaxID=2826895 RepID=A0ABT6TIQ7_9BACL|nr:3-oxoacyl-ACP reductase family protein [Cohnella hashimotonis]MDI4645834.1 3-oxoacyl-ACP reductase family protein [Cohnella hashimotonis]